MAYYFKDIVGERFGRLIAIEIIGRSKKQSVIWKCKCDCGNFVNVICGSLTNGNTKSCGCLQIETAKKMKKTHGQTFTRIYKIWNGMKGRCNSVNQICYKNYGGRGIKVCNEWNDSFENFRDWALSNGYEEKLTIDRINNNGNYEPSNCRWVSQKNQMCNTRRNIIVEYKGETMALSMLCEKYKKNYNLVYSRYRSGKSIDDCINWKWHSKEKYRKEFACLKSLK